jgi:hypothetical protein
MPQARLPRALQKISVRANTGNNGALRLPRQTTGGGLSIVFRYAGRKKSLQEPCGCPRGGGLRLVCGGMFSRGSALSSTVSTVPPPSKIHRLFPMTGFVSSSPLSSFTLSEKFNWLFRDKFLIEENQIAAVCYFTGLFKMQSKYNRLHTGKL